MSLREKVSFLKGPQWVPRTLQVWAEWVVLVLRAVCDFQRMEVGGRGPRHLPQRSLGMARGRKCSSRGGRRPRDRVKKHRPVGDGEGSRFKGVPPPPHTAENRHNKHRIVYEKCVIFFVKSISEGLACLEMGEMAMPALQVGNI